MKEARHSVEAGRAPRAGKARREPAVRRYRSFEDDFVATADQGFELPADYEWAPRAGLARRAGRAALYRALYAFGRAYLWAHLRWRVVGRLGLKASGGAGRPQGAAPRGAVLYCNHTQPVGDAFAPAVVASPAHIWVLVSPSNLGIPVLGKLLPGLGALPVPQSLSGGKKLLAAVSRRLSEGGVVVVYPEAHVWPYCSWVRPFSAASFAYAVDNHVPAYCMTTTYQRRRHGDKPRATAYIDGPFWASSGDGVSRRAAREALRDQVLAAMRERSRLSTYEYVRYEPYGLQDAREAREAG